VPDVQPEAQSDVEPGEPDDPVEAPEGYS
jgi:hypothetical protein